MTKDECFELEGTPLVKLLDGSLGMFLIYPIGKGDREGLCGIQVSGEEEHRWINCSKLKVIKGNSLQELK